MVLYDSNFPAVKSGAVVDVVRRRIELRCRGNRVRVAIGAATHREVRNALVDFDFVVLNAVLGGFSLGYIGKIIAEPLCFNVCLLGIIRLYQAFIGAIRHFVVIPKLLASVFLALGIDFASVRHITGHGIGLGKGIVRSTRGCIAKALQQARVGENRIALLARQAYLLKLCCDLIRILVIAQIAEQT